MSIKFRYPNITGKKESEQISQIRSYLHQLVEQLNNELPNIGTGDGVTQSAETNQSQTYSVQGGELSYYELRSLVIQELQKVERLVAEFEQKMEDGSFDGHTPQKGVDYFTEDEIASVAKQAAGKIKFTLDEDGNLYYEVEE